MANTEFSTSFFLSKSVLKVPRWVQNSKKCGWCRGCQTVKNELFFDFAVLGGSADSTLVHIAFVDSFSQCGKGKEKRFTPPKLQASTLVDPGDFVKIKGWDGHSTDGGRFHGKGQASGRVDVPVGAA